METQHEPSPNLIFPVRQNIVHILQIVDFSAFLVLPPHPISQQNNPIHSRLKQLFKPTTRHLRARKGLARLQLRRLSAGGSSMHRRLAILHIL